jgi:hypothetical protein
MPTASGPRAPTPAVRTLVGVDPVLLQGLLRHEGFPVGDRDVGVGRHDLADRPVDHPDALVALGSFGRLPSRAARSQGCRATGSGSRGTAPARNRSCRLHHDGVGVPRDRPPPRGPHAKTTIAPPRHRGSRPIREARFDRTTTAVQDRVADHPDGRIVQSPAGLEPEPSLGHAVVACSSGGVCVPSRSQAVRKMRTASASRAIFTKCDRRGGRRRATAGRPRRAPRRRRPPRGRPRRSLSDLGPQTRSGCASERAGGSRGSAIRAPPRPS